MKQYALTYFLLFVYCFCLAQSKITEAPLNSDFIYYLENGPQKLNRYSDYQPPPHLPNFDYFYRTYSTKKSTLFSPVYDLRKAGWNTSVKDQLNCGGCWNFVVMGAIESNYWKQTNSDTLDLSEQNMRTCRLYEMGEDGTCTGGNHIIATAYLTRRAGPVNEIDDPYNDNKLATCIKGLNPVVIISEAFFLPKIPNIIKQTIIEHGAIYSSMYWDEKYFNNGNNTYYYNGDFSVNHAVLIVGWDDTKVTMGGTGAWIIKNSWGKEWGENGYAYISYKDTKILSSAAYFPVDLNYNPKEKIYMYDSLGVISHIGFENVFAYGLVRFVAKGNIKLTKIGTFINADNAEIHIDVFDEKFGDNLINRIATVNPLICTYPGYYTFELPTPITITDSSDFYIRIKYTTPGYIYPVPVEQYYKGYSNPTIEKEVCWISHTGEKWEALGRNKEDKRDLCIRAYVVPDTLFIENSTKIKIFPNPTQGLINIRIDNVDSHYITIKIYNSIGLLVYTNQFNDFSLPFIKQIRLYSSVYKGLYIAVISHSGISQSIKFIVE